MRFVHFFSLHFIFCIFYVNIGVSAKPRYQNSSNYTNIEPDVNKTILSTIEKQLKVNKSVIEAKPKNASFEVQQNTTEKAQIEVPTKAINYQNANEKLGLVTSEVAFRIEKASLNPYNKSGTAEIEGLSIISSNINKSNSTVDVITKNTPKKAQPITTAAVVTIKYNTTEKTQSIFAPQKKNVSSPRNVNNGELLNIPRVIQTASPKLSNLKYVFVYNQEPMQNFLSKILINKPEVHTKLNTLKDVDTDLSNSSVDHFKTKRATKSVK